VNLDPYPWLKALHVAAAMTFVGGMLGVAVHLRTPSASDEPSPKAHRIVRAWDRTVTTPAMLIVWALGLTLVLRGGWFVSGWLAVKLALVAALSVIHGVQSGRLRRLVGGAELPSWPRAIAPIILGLLTAIAVLVVAKPF
jgi:putative membrane protein